MEVDAKLSLDIGDNIAKLLSKLAEQLGMTVSQILPYFSRQAYIQGLTDLVTAGLTIIVFTALLGYIIGARKPMLYEQKKIEYLKEGQPAQATEEGITLWAGVVLVSFLVIVVTIAILLANISEWMAKIYNPEYYGIRSVVTVVQQLTHK